MPKIPRPCSEFDVTFYTTPNTPPTDASLFCPNEDYSEKLKHQKALAIDLIQEQLIRDYESKDMKNESSHMNAQDHDKRTRKLDTLIKLCSPTFASCNREDASSLTITENALTEYTELEHKDDYWPTIFDKPTTTVAQSAFAAALEAEVKAEITRCGCSPPIYEIDRLYDDLRHGRISMNATIEPELEEYVSVKDSMQEPEERLLARLKIYERSMCSLIHHFKNLRPILSAIKRNYEGLLGLRDRQIHDIYLIKSNIGFAEQSYDIRLTEVSAEGYNQLCEAEKRCFLLLRHADKQDTAMRTMTEILNNLEKSLEEEISLKISSEEKRKKLIIEINDLRRQMNESTRILGLDAAIQAAAAEKEATNDDDLNSVNDSGILRTALENMRKNLSNTQHRLTILEADYSDVIPKKDFDDLQGQMSEAEKNHKSVQDDYDTLYGQVCGFRDQIDALIAERDDFQELVMNLKFKATPRPSWSKIAEFVEGGMSRWQEIYKGKSSKQIVDHVVEVLTGKKIVGSPDMIKPVGTDSSVPPYLQYDEPIRHRHFTRRETAILVHDIQQFRIEQLEALRKLRESQEDDYDTKNIQVENVTSFVEYVTEYFSERFPWPNLRAEWMYNLVDGCRRFPQEYVLTKFLGILEGRIDEALLHVLRSDIGRVRNILLEKSQMGNQSSISTAEFAGAMREAFPHKTEEEISSLGRVAAKQTGAVADWFMMKFVNFFVMTDEGLVGDFIEEVIKQYDADRLEYIYEILNVLLSELGVSLQSAERENDPAGETDVSQQQIYNAIVTVDPLLPEEQLAAALVWIFFGESTLPGMPPKGLLLVRYLEESSRRNPNEDSDEEDAGDDAEFERAVEEIQRRDNNFMFDSNAVNEKKRKAMIKKLKVIPLRIVVMRLKGGCLFRFGRKTIVMNNVGNPSTLNSASKPPPSKEQLAQSLKKNLYRKYKSLQNGK